MKRKSIPSAPRVLVVDVGGTHVKILASGHRNPRKFDSGPKMTAADMVRGVLKLAHDWEWDVVSMGYPGPVVHGRPLQEPYNLGGGWVRFPFAKAFGCPVRILNDAAMQALGSYKGGRMLFLGLGTGLGSAMIAAGVLEPMELAHMQFRKGRTYEDYLGLRGLERLGHRRWKHYVKVVVEQLRTALEADYVVLGGGNVNRLKQLPPGARRGDNRNAFRGGFRMWQPGAPDTGCLQVGPA